MKNRKILILSYNNPIKNNPRTTELLGILDLLISKNFILNLYMPKLKYSIKDHFRYKLYNLKKAKIVELKHCRIDEIHFKSKLVSKFLIKFFRFLSPLDEGIYFSVYFFLIIFFKQNKYDNIICVANNPSVILFSVLLKKLRISNHIILDVGDPFSKLPLTGGFKELKKKLWQLSEKYISKNVNLFIFPVRSMINEFKYLDNNYKIIPQIFPKKFLSSDYQVDSKYFNMLYAGCFYENYRDPKNLFDALESLYNKGFKIKLHFFETFPDNNIKFIEYLKTLNFFKYCQINSVIDREYLLSIMKKMDLLINILNKDSNQFPSKILDYRTANKPILNIGYNDSLGKYGDIGTICLNDKNEIENTIKKFINFKKNNYSIKCDNNNYNNYNCYINIFK